jgi:hypothetical protein
MMYTNSGGSSVRLALDTLHLLRKQVAEVRRSFFFGYMDALRGRPLQESGLTFHKPAHERSS